VQYTTVIPGSVLTATYFPSNVFFESSGDAVRLP
jgi:hypothetical protein